MAIQQHDPAVAAGNGDVAMHNMCHGIDRRVLNQQRFLGLATVQPLDWLLDEQRQTADGQRASNDAAKRVFAHIVVKAIAEE